MADSKRRKASSPPATTPEGREKQLIAAAVDLVEKKIRAGTATSQELTHFLKLASTREQLEQERLRRENALLQAKVESLASQGRVEELYKNAIEAFRTYSGNPDPDKSYEDQILCGAHGDSRSPRALRVLAAELKNRGCGLRLRALPEPEVLHVS